MPFGMGFGELVLILIIVVVVFGATKLPQLGDGLGKAIKNFKRAVNSQNEIDVSPGAKDKKGELDDEPASPSSKSSKSTRQRAGTASRGLARERVCPDLLPAIDARRGVSWRICFGHFMNGSELVVCITRLTAFFCL